MTAAVLVTDVEDEIPQCQDGPVIIVEMFPHLALDLAVGELLG